MSFNEAATKGKQMLNEGEKSRNATLDGYFAEEYIRLFAGEAYSDPVRQRRQQRLLSKEKNLSKDWIPQQGIKWPSVSRSSLYRYIIACLTTHNLDFVVKL